MTPALPHPLIDAPALRRALGGPQPPLVFDASFELSDPAAGARQYAQGHIPGARYVHLDLDLSAQPSEPHASGGRHPLPSREAFAQRLRAWGVRDDDTVVVYDRQGGMVCGRLWWMLRWCGHARVHVLDGGWAAWRAAGGEVAVGEPDAARTGAVGDFSLRQPLVHLCSVQEVAARLGDPTRTVVDARAAARYRGELEPLDPVAGHIPGALNRPYTDNFDADGRYKAPAQLRTEWHALLAGRDPHGVVVHCGSGVSAVPHVIAMTLAGLPAPTLMAGSWSEWCATPGLPCARSV
ncbi:thiosulfate/3-mercaptopyruvate sulfurtransferase [Tepidimonas ignava]|uniref:Thiosulfate sulfurtransferase SseB n=1 Tax=Tepidimonas ignava TaxID=114249 RepID=A0A4R3LK67_9BURK|nr:sulfurtransferase [Tepidimonas ignava]TCS99898.1 thiosulfate/3-mercaptopyruvate sulfurtransferase [Tepidimonas ignava]TSE23283.1 putative thiosulfate sulfurtransferase SseB [Tepidimonas ignava]